MTVYLQGYSVKERIGEGGFGDVFRAIQTDLDREVALKTLRLDLASKASNVMDFLSQAKLAAKLEHPNIVRIYDSGTRSGVSYISMQYIKGHSLNEILNKRAPLAPSEAVKIARQIADALDYAHKREILHADLNPGNILVTAEGTVYLTDFRGIGRPVTGERVVGVPEYVSPEQARGNGVGPASDIYSLGIILYHMLSGHPPFSELEPFDTLNKHISEKVPPLKSPVHAVPEKLVEYVLRLLSKSADERPTAAEVREEMTVLSSTIKPVKPKERKPVPRSRKIAAVLAIPVAVACWFVGAMIFESVRAERALDKFATTQASALAKERAQLDEGQRREREYEKQMKTGHDMYVNRQFSPAEEAFRQASHLKPKSIDPRMFLAALYIEQEQYDRAEWHLMQILQMDPNKKEAQDALTFVRGKIQASPVEFTGP